MPPTEYSKQFARMGKPVQYRSYGGWTYRIFSQFENGDCIGNEEAKVLVKQLKFKGITAKGFPWKGGVIVYEKWQR